MYTLSPTLGCLFIKADTDFHKLNIKLLRAVEQSGGQMLAMVIMLSPVCVCACARIRIEVCQYQGYWLPSVSHYLFECVDVCLCLFFVGVLHMFLWPVHIISCCVCICSLEKSIGGLNKISETFLLLATQRCSEEDQSLTNRLPGQCLKTGVNAHSLYSLCKSDHGLMKILQNNTLSAFL